MDGYSVESPGLLMYPDCHVNRLSFNGFLKGPKIWQLHAEMLWMYVGKNVPRTTAEILLAVDNDNGHMWSSTILLYNYSFSEFSSAFIIHGVFKPRKLINS